MHQFVPNNLNPNWVDKTGAIKKFGPASSTFGTFRHWYQPFYAQEANQKILILTNVAMLSFLFLLFKFPMPKSVIRSRS